MNSQGKLVVVEGIDGSGTTTITTLLEEELRVQGFKVARSREPGSKQLFWCEQVRRLIFENFRDLSRLEQMLLFWTDRAHHYLHFVKPALSDGMIVLLDRSSPSTYAYQVYGARNQEQALLEELFFNHDVAIRGGIIPDIILFLDVKPEVGISRSQKKGETTETLPAIDGKLETQIRLQAGYHQLALLGHPFLEISGICRKWIIINADQDVQAVFNASLKEVMSVIGNKKKERRV